MRNWARRQWVWCSWCGTTQRRWVKPEGLQTFKCKRCEGRFTWLPHAFGPWSQRVINGETREADNCVAWTYVANHVRAYTPGGDGNDAA